MINNLKTTIIIVLVITAIILNWRLGSKQKEIDNLAMDNGILADKLKCQIVVEKDRIVYKTRVKSNDSNSKEISSKVITKTECVPFAGSGTVGKTAKLLNRLFFLTEKEPKYFEYMKSKLKSQPLSDKKETRFFNLERFKEDIK